MTVEYPTAKISYKGNGSTRTFSFNFPIQKEEYIKVTTTDLTTREVRELNLGSDFAVVPADDTYPSNGGSVTYPKSTSAPALASGMALTITRTTPYTQPDVYSENSTLIPKQIERSLDNLEQQIQQLNDKAEVAIHVPDGLDFDNNEFAVQLLEDAQLAKQSAVNAKASETNAKASENSAKSSATSASQSAQTATTKANEASSSATKAKTSETNAKTSETNAKTSENNAKNSATSASQSAETATTKASEASSSATSASQSAETATTKASEASSSATSAKESETNAKASELNAKKSEENTKESEANASQYAQGASSSEANANQYAQTAIAKAQEASSSATSAKESETNAKSSATSASQSAQTATTKASEASSSATSAKESEAKALEYAERAENASGSVNNPVSDVTVKDNIVTVTKGEIGSVDYTVDNVDNANHATTADNATRATTADIATKATQDSQGQAINTTYIKGVTGSNATLTITKGDGSTSTITVNDVSRAEYSDRVGANAGYSNSTVGSALKNGISQSAIYNNNFPFSYGNLISIKNAGANQIALEWTGTTGAVGKVAVRCARDAGLDTWSAWRTLAYTESPEFTGTPTSPTPNVDANNTQIATTKFVRDVIDKYAPIADMLKKAYPVGSVYTSTVSTNPATLFGFGTWEALPAGRVLLAQGTASWGTYNAGSEGGEATHTLSLNEIPSHGHTGSTNTVGNHQHEVQSGYGSGNVVGIQSNSIYKGNTPASYGLYTTGSGSHTHSVTINATGGGQSHNNMQPYLAVYMWKRTA